jgi:hypothetical protein
MTRAVPDLLGSAPALAVALGVPSKVKNSGGMRPWARGVVGCGVLFLLAACGSSATAPADASGGGQDGPTGGDGPDTLMPDAEIMPDAAITPDASGGGVNRPTDTDADSSMADAIVPAIEVGEVADGSATAGQALGKFCHQLNRGGSPVILTLEIGDAPTVRITAQTNQCQPPAGAPCPVIPAGQVSLRLFEGEKLLVSGTMMLDDGGEYLFRGTIGPETPTVKITAGRIAAGTCQSLDFPIPDAGAD